MDFSNLCPAPDQHLPRICPASAQAPPRICPAPAQKPVLTSRYHVLWSSAALRAASTTSHSDFRRAGSAQHLPRICQASAPRLRICLAFGQDLHRSCPGPPKDRLSFCPATAQLKLTRNPTKSMKPTTKSTKSQRKHTTVCIKLSKGSQGFQKLA